MIARMCWIGWAWMVLAAGGAAAAAQPAEITARFKPDIVYAEQRGPLTRLNFDVELANPGAEARRLTYLELRVFDADGQIVARRYMGGNGLPGPIEMLPDREIPAGGSLYVFNPFPDMALPRAAARALVRVFHTGGSRELDIPLQPAPPPNLDRPPMAASYIYAGNDLFAHHRRVALTSAPARALGLSHIAQRYALDFTVLDPDTGGLAAGDGSRSADWLAYGAPVVSPADGVVVQLRADMPDNSFDETGRRVFAESFPDYGEDAGLSNFIILRIDAGFLVMSHFEAGSLQLNIGDRVRAGQPLGRIGMSGDTAYPHLHVQLQDGPDILDARPIPIVFDCVARDGAEPGPGAIDTGDFVSACPDR